MREQVKKKRGGEKGVREREGREEGRREGQREEEMVVRERERETDTETLTTGVLEAAWRALTCSTKPLQSKFCCEHRGQLKVDLFGPAL